MMMLAADGRSVRHPNGMKIIQPGVDAMKSRLRRGG